MEYLCNPLYGKDTKGNTKKWYVTVNGADIIVEHGRLGGKMQQRITTAKPKNVGKSNETTPEQQAQLEAQAKWTKQQLRKGYVLDIEDWGKDFFCMLAQPFDKFAKRCLKMIWEARKSFATQPKLDGVRAYLEGDSFMSRKREIYKPMQWLVPNTQALANEICEKIGVTNVIIDGEFWREGYLRQTISGAVKKAKDATPEMRFHVFDFYAAEKPDMTFTERLKVLESLISFNDLIMLVPSTVYEFDKCWTKEHIEKILLKDAMMWVDKGYEGGMGRLDGAYEPNIRSNNLWKVKFMQEDEFEIVGTNEKKPVKTGDKDMRQAIFVVKLPNGLTTEVAPKGTLEFRQEIAYHPERFIGKQLSTQYQGWTEDGDLEFAVGLEVRHDI